MAQAPAGILTVSEIVHRLKTAVESNFPAVWVKGEITNWKPSPRGHCYFDLKDRQSSLACMMWSDDFMRLKFVPRDGTQVEAFGEISVYEKSGKLQLYAREMRSAGLGALLQALEELKKKLQAEGLFDEARKRPLPRYPARVGLVTSREGAAVRDMVRVLQERWPAVRIVFDPVPVQGEGASQEIAASIARFNRRRAADVLIVGRGGGSTEDLLAFSDERVVRAIAGSEIPVISAVGHEVDVTLADLAADRRAATPSHAGQIAVRDRREVVREIADVKVRLERVLRHELRTLRQRFDHLLEKHAFRRRQAVFDAWRERIAGLARSAERALGLALESARARLARARDAYGLRTWPAGLAARRAEIDDGRARFLAILPGLLSERRRILTGYSDRLRALSPVKVMERGYCLVRGPDGTLLRSVETLTPGQLLRVQFARGEADARVEKVRTGEVHVE